MKPRTIKFQQLRSARKSTISKVLCGLFFLAALATLVVYIRTCNVTKQLSADLLDKQSQVETLLKQPKAVFVPDVEGIQLGLLDSLMRARLVDTQFNRIQLDHSNLIHLEGTAQIASSVDELIRAAHLQGLNLQIQQVEIDEQGHVHFVLQQVPL